MSSEVKVLMPLQLTPEMIRALRNHPTTSVADQDEWYTRLGWLVCAYDVLINYQSGHPTKE